MASSRASEKAIISNEFVTCYSDRVVIHLYYFPYGKKTIKYKDIQSCELSPLRHLNSSKYKKWGMGLSSIWWHSDIHRYYRQYYLLLKTHHWPHIGLTMDDEDIHHVYDLIKQQMNRNSSTEQTGIHRDEKQHDNEINSKSKKKIDYGNSWEKDREEEYVDWE